MTLRALTKCALLALNILRTIASPVGISATNSDELVRTPGGLISKSNVHLIPEGGTVVHTATAVQIISVNGTILHSAPLTGSIPMLPHRNVSGTSTEKAPRALQSGYVAFATYWNPLNELPISYFATTWSVPPAPENWANQTIYIFNALIPSSYDAILQPVLQYGYSPAGGGAYWSIASWYLLNTAVYYTSPIQVQPGQVLSGIITMTDSSTWRSIRSYLWYAYFVVDGDLNRSTVMFTNTTEVLDGAYEALEIYDVSTAADLPKGTTLMSEILLYTGVSQPSALNWELASDLIDNISMELISTSASNGELKIKYPTS